MKKILVTTSWDDGHKLDIRLAKLLKKYSLKGTFYISPKNREFDKNDLLTDQDIKTISKDFEIGAHTMTHPHLSKISHSEALYEIKNSKRYLEKIITKKIKAFCYPYGDYNQEISNLVKNNGFLLGRTIHKYNYLYKESDNYQLATTLECHRISFLSIPNEIYSLSRLDKKNIFETIRFFDWEYLAMKLFDRCAETGGVYHLWGHSWVIDKWKEWEKLERVLQHISKYKNAEYTTNSKILKINK